MTLASIISRIEAGETGRELEAEIGVALGAITAADVPFAQWINQETLPAYLTDLNAAVSLYPVIPETVSSDPRKVTCAALKSRIEQ